MQDVALLDCGHPPSAHGEIDTGYGTDDNGRTLCYACCAEGDRKRMRDTGRIILYLCRSQDGTWTISNWPGSLRLPCGIREGRHNIARTRTDVWFTFEGEDWHGVQYGEMTQLCHCRRIKSRKEGAR